MKILAFESSCDETAVAVVEDGRKVLTDQIFSQADLHAVYGGVVPEIASRSHVEVISRLAEHALKAAGIERKDIDAVAATYAPGLIGTLLVGLNFAKSVALTLDVPLIPVHHIKGHVAANYIAYPELEPHSFALQYQAAIRLLLMFAVILILRSSEQRAMMRQASALIKLRVYLACLIPEVSPLIFSLREETTRNMFFQELILTAHHMI